MVHPLSNMRPASQGLQSTRARRFISFALLTAGLITLPGCGPKRLRVDYKNFEMAYADTSNHEVLLNLARLQNRDPTFFFKLGQITSQYRMNMTLNGNGSYINSGTSAPGFGNVTGGGSPALLYENDPTFTFIPVNDETNAQLVLQPVPAETFYDLYQQGWRIDQLFRLMVDRIEYTIPTVPPPPPVLPKDYKPMSNGCQVVTLRNVPPSTLAPSTDATLSQYVTFLRVSALMYALQQNGHLLLKGNKSFVPVDPQSYIPNTPKTTAAVEKAELRPDHTADAPTAAHADTPPKSSGPEAKDVLDAAAKNQSWRLSPDGTQWILGKTTESAEFYLNPLLAPAPGSSNTDYVPDTDAIGAEISADPAYKEFLVGPAMGQSLQFLAHGFSIEGSPGAQTGNPCTEPPHLYLRSLLGMMAAAAQEEEPFEAILHADPLVIPSKGEPPRGDKKFSELVPAVERLPTLRIRSVANENTKEDPALTSVSYNRKTYQIADVITDVPPENLYWNRDMFRLISQLSSQVTVDISKFPLPTTLQLHE